MCTDILLGTSMTCIHMVLLSANGSRNQQFRCNSGFQLALLLCKWKLLTKLSYHHCKSEKFLIPELVYRDPSNVVRTRREGFRHSSSITSMTPDKNKQNLSERNTEKFPFLEEEVKVCVSFIFHIQFGCPYAIERGK